MSAQIRWTSAEVRDAGPPTPYYFLAPYFRKWFKRPPPKPVPTDLKAHLEKLLKDTAKDAKKSKVAFESQIKTQKTEGENGERSSINFSWTGAGRGQGKIWSCSNCSRVVIAQVIGMAKDHNAIGAIASQLFATCEDHSSDGFDLWALYDLKCQVPVDFVLQSHKLLSGHLQLVFWRGAERIVIERWGLANITLKKFTTPEWLLNNAYCKISKLEKTEAETPFGHTCTKISGGLPPGGMFFALRDAKGSVRKFPTRYIGTAWHCEQTNKLYAIQLMHHRRSEQLWEQIMDRCKCH